MPIEKRSHASPQAHRTEEPRHSGTSGAFIATIVRRDTVAGLASELGMYINGSKVDRHDILQAA